MMQQHTIHIAGGVVRNPLVRLTEPVTLDFLAGEHIAIVGPNGAGKSLLVDMLTEKYPLRDGELTYDFSPSLTKTAYDNIKYIAFRDTYGSADANYYYQQRWNAHDQEDAPLVREVLGEVKDDVLRRQLFELFSIEPMLDKKIILLSSGELRRFQLTKALLTVPRILIMDNPFIGLDAPTRELLFNLLERLTRLGELQIVLVLSMLDDIPSFITHVVPVEDMKVGEKMEREEYVQAFCAGNQMRIQEEAGALEELQRCILDLPYEHANFTSDEVVKLNGVSIRYDDRTILKELDWTVMRGEKWALSGENGAGKSTLMKCLFGIYHKDEGTIKLRGQEVNFQSPHEALLNGISMVHQELEQVPERSVMENVWLGRFPKKFGLIDTAKMVKDTEAVLATLGGEVKIDPRARLSSLTVSKRQMVDIAKAVSYNCDIIALDEPTSSLNEKEVDILMEIIDGLRRQGKGIIYISHKMEEIFRIADDITVMRDGALIKTMRAAETNVDEVIRLMVGRELTDRFPPKQGTIGKEILVVKDLNDLGHHIHDISFDLHEGEVLGIAGLLGAGRTELLETLFGARTRESGTVTLKGKEIRNKSTAEAIKNGFALCTEERRFNGIFPDLGLDFNTAIAGIGNYTNKVGWLSTKKMTEDTQKMINAMHTKTPSTKTKIRHLSGGNQQKVILGRWLLLNPDIFLLDDPTRGIDVGAKYEIYQLIFNLAKQNKGVIICSSEMPELLGICDRVLVLSSGHLTGEYDLVHDREHATQENIMVDATKFV